MYENGRLLQGFARQAFELRGVRTSVRCILAEVSRLKPRVDFEVSAPDARFINNPSLLKDHGKDQRVK